MPLIKEWQERQLEEVYAVVYMDAIHYHVRSKGRIVKRAVYVAIGIDMSSRKDVLGMCLGENESAKFWLSILNGLRNRGVEDILIICIDGLTGSIRLEGRQKTLTLETPPAVHYCPQCGSRMHSRGIKRRQISHPILQDGYELFLLLKQRRWRCTNPNCSYETNEEFRFVSKNRQITNAADILIVFAFKDLSESASSIARRFHTSDTYGLDVFNRFVNMDRPPLTDIISIDEVHIDMDPHCK